MTTCSQCKAAKSTSEVRHPDGTTEQWCTDCWNQSVYDRRAARKAQLAQRPRCEACGKRAGTWNAGAGQTVLICGWCKRRALELAQSNAAKGPAFLGMFGPQLTGSAVLALLKSSQP